jgi:hypothetical protein
MNQDEIIEMAKKSNLLGVIDCFHYTGRQTWIEEATAFAKLVAAKEREACEKECQDQFDLAMSANEKAKRIRDKDAYYNSAIGSRFCLLRIRSRGEA